MSNFQPKVSVIIPVYNVERYLRECLESVVNQTLREIEIICVNDGSTDGSGEILREYAEKDARIRIIEQENAGQSAARNAAIKAAEGKFLALVDSDDMIVPDALQRLCDRAEQNDLDEIIFEFEPFYESEDLRGKFIYETKKKRISPAMKGEDLYRVSLDEGSYFTCACQRFYKRDFFVKNALYFETGIVYEDELHCMKVDVLAPRAQYTNEVFYKYRIRANSTTTSQFSTKKFYSLATIYFEAKKFCMQAQLKEETKEAIRNYFENLMTWIFQSNAEFLADDKICAALVENERLFWYCELEKRLRKMQSDPCYRIGRAITWLPRKIRGTFRWLKTRGLRATVRHATGYVLRKLSLIK